MVAIINADFTSATATLTYDDKALSGLTTRTSYITDFINKDGFDFLICKGARIKGDIPAEQRIQTPGGPAELPLYGSVKWLYDVTPGTLEKTSENDNGESEE